MLYLAIIKAKDLSITETRSVEVGVREWRLRFEI